MILAKGKLYGEEEREVLLARLEDEINETRVRAPLRSETVIAALDALGRHIENGQFDAQLAALGLSRRTDAVRTATAMLRRENLEEKLLGMAKIRDYAAERLSAIPDLKILSAPGGAPHILSISLVGWPSQNIVNDLGSQGVCISAGSACHQGKPSHVIAALKLSKKVSGGVIRLSFGPETDKGDIDACADALRRHHDTRMPML